MIVEAVVCDGCSLLNMTLGWLVSGSAVCCCCNGMMVSRSHVFDGWVVRVGMKGRFVNSGHVASLLQPLTLILHVPACLWVSGIPVS